MISHTFVDTFEKIYNNIQKFNKMPPNKKKIFLTNYKTLIKNEYKIYKK